jgi:hypothetical protein
VASIFTDEVRSAALIITEEAEPSLGLIATRSQDRRFFTNSRLQLLPGTSGLPPCFAFSVEFAAFAHFYFSFLGIEPLDLLVRWGLP